MSRWVIENKIDADDPVITFDFAQDWVDTAPDDILRSTRLAASHLRELPTGPHPPELRAAIAEIDAYADDHCRAVG